MGFVMGFSGVQVQVGNSVSPKNPYPWHGFWVTHTVTHHMLLLGHNSDDRQQQLQLQLPNGSNSSMAMATTGTITTTAAAAVANFNDNNNSTAAVNSNDLLPINSPPPPTQPLKT